MTLTVIARNGVETELGSTDMAAIYDRIDRVLSHSHPLLVEMANGQDHLLFGLVHTHRIKARTTRTHEGVECIFADWDAIELPEKLPVIDARGAFACTTEFFMDCMINNTDLPVTADVAAAVLGISRRHVLDSYEPDATFHLARHPRGQEAGAKKSYVSVPVYSYTRCLGWLMRLAADAKTATTRAAA